MAVSCRFPAPAAGSLTRRFAALAGLAILCLPRTAYAGPIFPDDRAVGLEPPPGMIALHAVGVFADPQNRASIMLEELPPEQTAAAEERFAKGMIGQHAARLGTAEPLAVTGAEARLRRGHLGRANVWLVLLSRPEQIAFVTAIVQPGAYPDDAIETALRSIVFRAPKTIEALIEALDFRIGDMAGFRPVATSGASHLLLTEGPLDVVRDHSQPIVKITLRGERPLSDERSALARRLFGRYEDLDEIRTASVSTEGDILFADGTALDPISGRSIAVMQAIRFGADGNIRILGMIPSTEGDRFADRFRRLARSVEPKR